MLDIRQTELEIQREPFARPFAFKGSAFHEKWNLVVRLTDADGTQAYGIGGLAVLWSDARVFSDHTEVGGNVLQAALLERALRIVRGSSYADPLSMLGQVLPEVYTYGRSITGRDDLRLTFVLIALVALDNAAWMLAAKKGRVTTFDGLIPDWAEPALSNRQRRIALAPAVGYNTTPDAIRGLIDAGAHILKIKIGQPGEESEMAEKDKAWLAAIHNAAGSAETDATESGHVAYYLDANGRYRSKDAIAGLLDHAEAIGALDRIILVEEPFDESIEHDVSDLPACFAADESIHTVDDVARRAHQGFGALAIKPAGKTMSLAFEMAVAAGRHGLHPFVADNACVPVLVEWNKNIEARLPAFPGLKGGLIESNGAENYGRAWERMLSEFPIPDASWLRPRNGVFELNDAYYAASGGIFHEPEFYTRLFRN